MTDVLASYAIGVLGIVGVLALWVAVQSAWRRSFADGARDPDVLAGRTGCGGCGCTHVCERRAETDQGDEP